MLALLDSDNGDDWGGGMCDAGAAVLKLGAHRTDAVAQAHEWRSVAPNVYVTGYRTRLGVGLVGKIQKLHVGQTCTFSSSHWPFFSFFSVVITVFP